MEINPLQKTACEVQLKINKCDEIKSKYNDPQLLSHFETCRAQSTNGEISRAAINCAATFMLVGTYTLPKLAPAIATTVSKLPAALTKVGARVFAGLTILGPLVTTYTIGSMLNDGLETDKACFNNVELKTNYLNFANKKSEYLKEKLQAHLADSERRQLAFPEEYLKADFIKNLPCSRMFEILREQERKQTPIVGKLLAQKKIQTDPRDELPISDEDNQEIDTLKNVAPCLSPAKQAEIVCAISNLIVGGTRLTAAVKEFTRTPNISIATQRLSGSPIVSNHVEPALSQTVVPVGVSQILNKYPLLVSSQKNIDNVFDTTQDFGDQYRNFHRKIIQNLHEGYMPSQKHQDAIDDISKKMFDRTGWASYTKKLQTDAAVWIDKKGSAAERALLKKKGEVSERSILAVFASRIKERGETLGKVKEGDNFLEKAALGPFVDKGEFLTSHGEISHLIQMDYIAPALEKHYGKNSSEFYQYALTTTKGAYWQPIFDHTRGGMSMPERVKEIMTRALRLDKNAK
jgi:hypothetical protein